MLRGVLRVSTLTMILTIIVMVAMVVIGSGRSVTIAVAYIEPDSRLSYFDIESHTRIDYPIQVRNLVDVRLIDGSSGAFLLSQRGRRQEVINFAILFYFDPLHGRFAPIHTSTLAIEGRYNVRDLSDLSPRFSPDGQWLAYIDPDSKSIVIIDSETLDEDQGVFVQVTNINLIDDLYWSVDGQYLAVKTGVDEISVISRESARVKTFGGLQRGRYTPYWQDNETLLIQYEFAYDSTLMVNWINIKNDEIQTETWDLENPTPKIYWCDDTWLAHYDGQGIGKIRTINLKTSQRYEFEANERLSEASLDSVLWQADCEGLVLTLHDTQNGTVVDSLYSFVLSDPEANTMVDLATYIRPYGVRLEQGLFSYREINGTRGSTLNIVELNANAIKSVRQFDDPTVRDETPFHWFDNGQRALYQINGRQLAVFSEGRLSPLIKEGENSVAVTLYTP